MEVLLLTNSRDGSSDIIANLLNKKKIHFLRWNIDLWDKYEILINDFFFEIKDPLHRKVSSINKVKILWRKPFSDYVDLNPKYSKFSAGDRQFIKSQIKTVLYSLVSLAGDYSNIFIDPTKQMFFPKIKQLKLAKPYFNILPYEFSVLKNYKYIKNSITKPLGNSQVDNQIMYTTRLNQSDVHRPYPWFFQEGIYNGQDVTCVYIKGEVFFYKCEYLRSEENLDWRIEINSKDQSKWSKLDHENLTIFKKKVVSLMNDFKLNYGRLDFLLSKNELFFLECNPNGQFGWLDNIENPVLHKKFLNAFLEH